MTRLSSALRRCLLLPLLLLLLLCSYAIPTAEASGATSASSTCTTLCYYGGPVQHHPKVYLIFWGGEWTTDQYGVIPAMVNLFGHLAGGAYNNILNQYYDSSGPIANDTTLETTAQGRPYQGRPYFIDDVVLPPQVSWDNIGQEAATALVRAGGVSSPDTQVLVFPEQGTAYGAGFSDLCGKHGQGSYLVGGGSVQVFFGFVRFIAPTSIDPNSIAGCDNTDQPGNTPKAMTMVASHEYAETATDPMADNSGWSRGPGTGNTEIGDIYVANEPSQQCNQTYSVYTPTNGNGITITVQKLYSLEDTQCMGNLGEEFASPDSSPPFNHQHTVWGGILEVYNSLGANSGSLREPVSEQTLIAGGAVSYFVGPSACNPTGPKGSCGAIYYSPTTGANAIWGDSYLKYLHYTSSLGFPVSNPLFSSQGAVSYFVGHSACNPTGPNGSCGAIYWSSATGANAIWGDSYLDYLIYKSSLGLPVSDPLFSSQGAVSYFVGPSACSSSPTKGPNGSCGAIYWSSATGANAIWGDSYLDYLQHTSSLGLPVSNPLFFTGGAVSYFVGPSCSPKGPNGSCGAIYWSSATGAHAIWGEDYLNYYFSHNGPGGSLGLPVSDPLFLYGGAVSYFVGPCTARGSTDTPQNNCAAIYWSSSTGAHAVEGGIYLKYISIGGPNGSLGLPVSDQYINTSGNYQSDFVGGSITWVNGVAVVTYNCPNTLCN